MLYQISINKKYILKNTECNFIAGVEGEGGGKIHT